jgi:hypothetical protein
MILRWDRSGKMRQGETAARNSEINTELMNGFIKSTQALFYLLTYLHPLNSWNIVK